MHNVDNLNNLSWPVLGVAVAFMLLTFWSIAQIGLQLIRRQRRWRGRGWADVRTVAVSLVALAGLSLALDEIPDVFMQGDTWNHLMAVGSPVLTDAIDAAIAAILLFYIHFLIGRFTVKTEDRSLFSITTFSVVSGCSYAVVMFIVNQALSSQISKLGLGGYFVLALAFYVFGQKLVREQLTELTNNYLYQKRVELIAKFLKTPFFKMEAIGQENIYTSLNNDTETISASIGLIVIGVTSTVTILVSFVYLGVSNIYGLLTSVIMVAIAGCLLVLVNKSAEKFFGQARDTQNVFFKFINDLVKGFKELYLNKSRRREFQADMVDSCDEYRGSRISADKVSSNVYFVGELLAFIVLGGLLFLLPTVLSDIRNATLSQYVMVFLFLKGPLDNVLNMIPRITQVKVSLKRIHQIDGQISSLESDVMDQEVQLEGRVHFELQDVEYRYKNTELETFEVGPINYEFQSGEIIFITGGNGSGKSTLAKLITGLYAPDDGRVLVNGQAIDTEAIGQYFSTVFTDYFLFDKLYGIDFESNRDKIDHYLQALGIEDKLQVVDGIFSTTKLSTGQKKRLALLISYLEDRPAYLFDEWAADQDPEFRSYFYQELLPAMKANGKCIIAITHDDRYFHLADRVIKMESGHIVEQPVLAV